MLLPEDDYPLHQDVAPLASTMGGHPNAYDRFWFNGYDDEIFFAVAMGLYPNRGVIDAAFSVVVDQQQYSVFSSDALVGRDTAVGAVTILLDEPMRKNRIVVHAPDQGLFADLTYEQRTATIEEPRQTMMDGPRVFMDVTRATQLGTWRGTIDCPAGRFTFDGSLRGTKDRSWGIRPVGEPLPGAPSTRAPQLCFVWVPMHLENDGAHVMYFADAEGRHLHHSAGRLPLSGPARHVRGDATFTWQPGTRWLASGVVDVDDDRFTLTPRHRFHMRGAGYGHPTYAHGRWHGGAITDGEVLDQRTLNPLEYHNVHVQHVVDVRGPSNGLGVVEQLIVGPYAPAGLRDLLDGA